MSDNRSRDRMVLFIVLSLLAHAILVTYIIWNPLFDEKKQDKKKTVQIQLKKHEEPESKAAAKKTDAKVADVAQEESKKAEAKKAEAKKAEPNKEETKKTEAKKAVPKKTKPKKTEPKKTKPKKAEPKKAEPKKAEPKKTKPKKTEPKKTEPKKAEPKKQEKEIPDDPGGGRSQQIDDNVMTSNVITEVEKAPVHITLPGSLRELDDDGLRESIIYVKGAKANYEKRKITARRVRAAMTVDQKKFHDQAYISAYDEIVKYLVRPKMELKDLGKKYFGEIRFLVDEEGLIQHIEVKRTSGSSKLDDAFYVALKNTKKLKLPEDSVARYLFLLAPKILYIDESDFAE